MAVDALGKTIVVDTNYVVVGQCKIIDGDAITLVLGNNNEAKLRVKAGAIAQAADVLGGGAWKQSVRVATTGAGTLSTSFENGDTIDGITLATGDRILIKNQAAGAENGIYTVNASGAPTRTNDASTGAQLLQATVGVQQGTLNANRVFVCFTDAPITIGVTATAWATLTAVIQAADQFHNHDAPEIFIDGSGWTGALQPLHDGIGGPVSLAQLCDYLDTEYEPPTPP